jgi:COP9 signalosome complex subunit 1
LQAHLESEALKKRLEADLNAAKANNIRESIRQSSMDLGMYHFERSDFVWASKMFMRTRDHCSNNSQMLDFCLAVLRTYVLTQNWPMVSPYVGKAEGILADPKTDRHKQIQAQMHAVAGLADLSMGRYRQAAVNFSKVGSELGSSFDDVIASIDVARYGVLTALATHDRTAIRSQFLNSQTFSTHLECMLEVL